MHRVEMWKHPLVLILLVLTTFNVLSFVARVLPPEEPLLQPCSPQSPPTTPTTPNPAGLPGEVATKSLTQEERLYTEEGHHRWAADGLPQAGLAIFTREAQRFIWRYLNRPPEECAKALYLRGSNWRTGGMGSQMHVAAMQMAEAMSQDRIWLWHPGSGDVYAMRHLCDKTLNWLCFFLPPSNCSTFAKPDNTVQGTAPNSPGVNRDLVPPQIREMLAKQAPHMRPLEMKHWWRTQVSAYLMRLNARTVSIVAKMRQEGITLHIEGGNASGEAVARLQSVERQPLFPLPRGTVSLPVRHGDKFTEMRLQALERYLEKAEQLYSFGPLLLQRTMFVASEDPQVIADAANNSLGWVSLYLDMPRNNSAWKKGMTDDAPYLHLLQLLMALECDAWVGTLRSNWNQLIAELRCVWVAKCAYPFVELNQERSDWRQYL